MTGGRPRVVLLVGLPASGKSTWAREQGGGVLSTDEIRVLLVNTDPSEPFTVQRGDRIAQLVVQQVETIEWEEVDTLDDTERGLGGWGSTGHR